MTKDDFIYWISKSGVPLNGVNIKFLAEYLSKIFEVERLHIYKEGYEQGKFDERMEQLQNRIEKEYEEFDKVFEESERAIREFKENIKNKKKHRLLNNKKF